LCDASLSVQWCWCRLSCNIPNRWKSDGAHWSVADVHLNDWSVVNFDHYLNNIKNFEFLFWSDSSHKKKDAKHIASPWPCQATHKCAQLRQSQNLNGQCSYTHVTALTPNHQIFASFVFFKNTGYSSLAQMPRHCRIPYTSGCR
jgi:hypothetical protein